MAAPLDRLMLDRAISYAALGAACAWGAWAFQANKYEREISELRTEYATAQVRAVEHAHAETIRLQAVNDEAERLAQIRLAAMARSAAAVRDERDRLRDELAASRVQLPDASCTSVREYAATLSTVFGLCADRLEGLAREAQGHASDSLKLQQAGEKEKR